MASRISPTTQTVSSRKRQILVRQAMNARIEVRPGRKIEDVPEWLGKRRQAEPVGTVAWRWPGEKATARQRYQSFDDWHDIAMQIIDKQGGSFRLLATYKKVIHWKSGEIWSTDEELASRSGCCSARTISRDIADQRRRGIILVDNGWRKVGGNFLRTRTIRLALPDIIPPFVVVTGGTGP